MNLDNPEEIKKVDVANEYASIPDLPKQCQQAWDEASQVVIPEDYKAITNLVMCGMGGSGLGARVIESVYKDELQVPLTRVNDYDLPDFVNDKSLVVCSSYSGTTEETLENLRQAREKKAKIICISAGSIVTDLPCYQINPTYNPSGQPRMAIGYSIIGQIALLSKLSLISFSSVDLTNLVTEMESVINLNKLEVSATTNPAKILALELQNKVSLLVSAEHLVGATHVFNNQINENAKTFSADFAIPELNHHLMEGLGHPRTNSENLHFIFVDSNLFTPRITKRFEVTKDVVGKNDIRYSSFTAIADTKIAQAFEVIQFGAFVNFYLAMLNKENPTPIPWVDYFKAQLA